MELFQLHVGEGPLVAAAIHNGHFVREELAGRLAVGEADRLREEDPYTENLIDWAPTRLIGRRSRYEMDLNRPRELAIYRTSEESWGVSAWTEPLLPEMIEHSLANYDLFYAAAEVVLRQLVQRQGRVIVLDVHSYNHRREGVNGELADPEGNPEVNVGTGSLSRERWGAVVDEFMTAMRSYDYLSRRLDVRENVRFQGGHFCRWIHETFPRSVCAIAVEFKKFFIDEWTGEVDRRQLAALRGALESTAPRLMDCLSKLNTASSS